jgi:hypothetical protein
MKNIFNQISKIFQKMKPSFITSNSIDNSQKNTMEKITFQPNVSYSRNPLEFNTNNVVGEQEIKLNCSQEIKKHLEKVAKFFEISEEDALIRGLWLLTIVRDVEIDNKKIVIANTDSYGLVLDVIPINIV